MAKDQEIAGLGGASLSLPYEERIRHLENGVTVALETHGEYTEQTAWALKNLAEALRRNGEYSKATEIFERAKDIFECNNNRTGVVWCLWGIASIQSSLFEIERAQRTLKEALSIAHQGASPEATLWTEARVAEIDRIQGLLPRALDAHERLSRAFAEINDSRGVAWAVQGYAQIKRMMGDYMSALSDYQRALEISERLEDLRGVAFSLKGISSIEVIMYNLPIGKEYCERAIHMMKELGYGLGEAYCLLGLAEIELVNGDVDKACSIATTSLEIADNIKDSRASAYCQLTLGDIARLQQKYAEAQVYYDTAKHIFERGSIRLGIIRCLLGKSEVERIKGRRELRSHSLDACEQLLASTRYELEHSHLILLQNICNHTLDREVIDGIFQNYNRIGAKLAVVELEKFLERFDADSKTSILLA